MSSRLAWCGAGARSPRQSGGGQGQQRRLDADDGRSDVAAAEIRRTGEAVDEIDDQKDRGVTEVHLVGAVPCGFMVPQGGLVQKRT